MQNIRIYEIPNCKVVASGIGMFGDGVLERFDEWFSTLPRSIFPNDFLYFDTDADGNQGFRWIYIYQEGMLVPEDLEIMDYTGGLYAVTTDIDQQTDMDSMYAELDRFLEENGLQRDISRPDMGSIITSPAIQEILGYEQMDYWTPVKER